MTGYSTLPTKPTVNRNDVPSSLQREDSGNHDVDGLDLTILSVNAIPSSARIACTLVRYVQITRNEPLHISVLEVAIPLLRVVSVSCSHHASAGSWQFPNLSKPP
jgi:hypothetical protein